MAEMITTQKLIDADIDVDNLGKAANELGTVNPRYGNPYKTAPQAIQDLQQKADQVVAQGFYQGYTTETLLLAAKPAVAEMRARADDTRKIWRWNRTSAEGVTPITGTWTDTGLSELDQAKADATTKANAAEVNAIAYADNFIVPISTKAETIVEAAPEDKDWAVLDKFGRAALTVSKDGGVSAPNFKTNSANVSYLNGVDVKYQKEKSRIIPNIRTDVDIQLSYGQSLAIGSGAVYNIAKTPKNNNLMLDSGVNYSASTPTATSLVSAYTVLNVESPVVQAGITIRNLLEAEDGLSTGNCSYQIAMCATGQGNTTLMGLSKGTEPYSRNLIAAQKIKDLANADNKVVKSLGMYFTQGERDYDTGTTKATYKTQLGTIFNDLNTDIKAITKQSGNMKFIGYQTRFRDTYGTDPRVSLAQWEVSKERNDYFIACPMYMLLAPDNQVHPTAKGYTIMGAYYGLVYKRVVIDGENWKPLQPNRAESLGNFVLVNFDVPVGSLVVDTQLVPLVANFGFTVTKSDGSPYTILSVSVINKNTVKIVVSEPVVAGGVVKYAHTEAGGNLRDQQGDYITVNPVGGIIPMHNWCVISQVEIS